MELADRVYEDLQACYSVYTSIFHRWVSGALSAPAGRVGHLSERRVSCRIVGTDFFIMTFRQLEQLVRGGCWGGAWGSPSSVEPDSALGQVAEQVWVLMEELSSRMTLEVAAGLFELYLTLADLQRFWDCIPDRWAPSPLAPIRSPRLALVPLGADTPASCLQ